MKLKTSLKREKQHKKDGYGWTQKKPINEMSESISKKRNLPYAWNNNTNENFNRHINDHIIYGISLLTKGYSHGKFQ